MDIIIDAMESTVIREDHVKTGLKEERKEQPMSEAQELMKAIKEAGNLESLPWWRSKMKDLIPMHCVTVNGQARRYYKEKYRMVCWYRVIAEAELHRAR